MILDDLLVVVPVHDEVRLLDACLTRIGDASRHLPIAGPRLRTVVVLDACRDGSARVAARHDVEVVACEARNVGLARALGVATAARDVSDPSRAWVAATDADSLVPGTWLLDHLLAAERHDLLVGPVVPDSSDLHPAVLREWRLRHARSGHHVHGANLGVRLSTYAAAGGFPGLETGEDVALVERARRDGARLTGAARPVVTAARQHGRAPGGFAAYLAALALEVLPGATT